MAHELEIHPASPSELAAAHTNVFDIWSKGLSLEEHLRSRLSSPSHTRATWFVGCLDGRVVCSLGSYPLLFNLRGEELPGIAIGSVYTVKDCRGQGFAPQLLAWVEQYYRDRSQAVSVLYSDIDPQYYANMGYRLCPSWQGWRNSQTDLPPRPNSLRLTPVSAEENLLKLARLYADYHGTTPCSVARTEEYWRAIFKKFADDEFYALTDPAGEWRGYVRVGRKAGDWRITDFALADQSDALAAQLYAAFIELARAGGAQRVGGWLPDSVAARQFFDLSPRRQEITMIKPLAWNGTLDDAMIAATSRFCEVDHV